SLRPLPARRPHRAPRGGRGDPARRRAAGSAPGERGQGERARCPLHRLLHSRPARPQPDGERHLVDRVRHRHGAEAEAAQAPRGHADVPLGVPVFLSPLAAGLPGAGGGRAARLRRARLRRAGARLAGTLGFVSLVASLSFSALGLLVASRARTVEAVSGLANLVMLPMWIFSGVFFSAANFPAALQPFIHALPLTASVDALRAIMLRGA